MYVGVCALLLCSYQTVNAQASDKLYHYKQLDGTNPNLESRGTVTLQDGGATDRSGTATNLVPGSSQPVQKIPFDGGISLFVAAGIGLAAKRKYDKRKAAAANMS